MAARWGAGEDILTTCNMDFSPIETLDQAAGLSPGKALEALQSCSDPSILSIFEDMPAIEAKALDEESEATLLSALTEFLDDVDHNNLSPFETLLDSDLLSHQKCKELSPPRRMLCVSLSSQEKDSVCSVRPSAGKSLSRMQACSVQRSDGEEEDGSLTLSPNGQDSFPDQLEWERLTLPLPITFEQDGEDGLSVSLGDFVGHRHHNCIAICVEDEEGEQILPEGGIILEVVDQGENGEPILAIPNMDFPVSVEQMSPENEQKGLHEAGEEANDSSDHIVVDDEDVTTNKTASVTPGPCPGLKNEKATVRQEEQIKTNGTSRRKKKKKCKEKEQLPQPAEERVLRSGTVRKMAQETLKKPAKEKKQAVSKVLVTSAPSSFPTKAKEMKPFETKMQKEDKMNAHQYELNEKAELLPSSKQEALPSNATPEKGQPIGSVAAERAERPSPTPQPPVAPVEAEGSSAAPSAPQPSVTPESSAASPSSVTPEPAAPVSVAPPAPEPKPKSLSLEEYRRLRQQKRPALVCKQDGNSTKWPSLPEPPKELPPIPCLPDPSPKDPRRANTQAAKKEVEMVRPAWQPRGPAAPPTPEALLVPPAYMISSSSKVPPAALPKPQPTPDPSRQPPPAPVSEKSTDEASTGTMTDRIKTTAATAAHKAAAVSPNVPAVATSAPTNKPVASENGSSRPPVGGTQPLSPAAFCSKSQCPTKPALLETKEKPTTAVKPQRGKSATQELIEAFTTEIGIEAADLTSLLEQFEETQAKEEQNVPEVCGRAAAVGNSSTVLVPEKSIVERVRANDLSSTAALTPPATPPHQMWKPLAPLTLLGKSKATEATKSNPSKVIQIEAKPLPSVRSRSKTAPADAAVSPHLASMDHDYCLPNKCPSDGEQGKRWNVKQQSFITINPIKQQAPATKQTPPTLSASSPQSANPVVLTRTQDTPKVELLEKRRCDGPADSSVLETPDTSPARQETECALKVRSPRRGPSERSFRQHASPRSPSPRCSPQERSRGRYRKRSHHSPSSMSSCSESYSSRSRSPAKKRFQPRHSGSSSRSSSRSSSGSSRSVSRSPLRRRRRFSYSSSRSGSWSRSRSRSPSPQRRTQRDRSRRLCSPSYTHGYGHGADVEEVKRLKEKAIEERRIVYVGRIRGTMTQKELRERFSLFGEIEECTLHFRDHGDNYGFVTYYDTKDAFTAIENGSKLRKPDELPFDLCFGGRRQFCQTSYSDLDSSREYEPLPTKSKFHALDFDTLLKQAQQGLKR